MDDDDILLRCLEISFGFTGSALGWICSYLSGQRFVSRYSGPSSPAMRFFAQWSYRDWTIAMVYLDELRRAYSVSGGLLHDLSWCSLGKVTRLAKLVRGCTGLICCRECNSSSAASRSGVYTVLLLRIWRVTSLQSAQLRGRLAAAGLLLVPRTLDGDNWPLGFAVSSPAAWNSFSADLRYPGIRLPSFRKKLKTYLFNTPA